MIYFSPYYRKKNLEVLKKAKIPFKILEQSSIDQISKSILVIGTDFLGKKIASEKAKKFREKFNLQIKDKKSLELSIAIILGEKNSLGRFKSFYVAGNKSIYHDLLKKMNVKNIVPENNKYNVLWDMEKLLSMNPTHIVHLVNDEPAQNQMERIMEKDLPLTGRRKKEVVCLGQSSLFYYRTFYF